MTLEKAIDICCASEITSSQVKELTEKAEVNRLSSEQITVRTKDNESTANTGKTEQKEASCSRCGFKHATKNILHLAKHANYAIRKITLPECADHRISDTPAGKESTCCGASKSVNDMFIGTVKSEHEDQNAVTEPTETETVEEEWTEWLKNK